MARTSIISVFLFLLLCSRAWAHAWHVEKDGSGDFPTIFWAMTVAVPGDTIMIGPGRYDDFHPLVAPAWTTKAIVPVTKDNLTFIGAGNTSTIIGPTEMYLTGGLAEPKAIATVENVEAKFVNLGVENAYNGIYWADGRVEVENCKFEGYGTGIYLYGQGGGIVKNSEFYSEYLTPRGITTQYPCGPVTISGCSFGGPDVNEAGIGINGTNSAQIENCHFFARSAMIFSSSTGTVTNCTTTEAVGQAIWVTSGSQVEMTGNQLHGNYASIYVDSGSRAYGSGNIFSGGQLLATVYVSTQSTVQLNDNHIFHDGQLAVMLQWFFHALVPQDLTNNYWGTTNTDSIGLWIQDVNDDPSIHSVANFLPVADGPLPSEATSWGSVKALFR